MTKAFLLVGAMLAAFSIGSAAQARAGDGQWVACAWQTDAQAASNWLTMKPPVWQDKFGSSAELLGLRLIAMCDATPADPKKPNRVPNWKSMQQQLKRAQPKSLPAAGSPGIEVHLCQHYSVRNEERAVYLVETVRVEGNSNTTIHQLYFDQAGTSAVNVVDHAGRKVSFQFGGAPEHGSAIRMPQATLIASPSEGYASEKVCRAISNDGTLTDA